MKLADELAAAMDKAKTEDDVKTALLKAELGQFAPATIDALRAKAARRTAEIRAARVEELAARADEVLGDGRGGLRSVPPESGTKLPDSRPTSPVREASLELAEATSGLPTPAAAKAMWERYDGILRALTLKEDLVTIGGREYRKKSFWRRAAAAFGIRLEVRDMQGELEVRGERAGWTYKATVRAVFPGGRYADGVASCSTWERPEDRKEHDIYATAYTRAANRAIADLVAAGEVSAEEVE